MSNSADIYWFTDGNVCTSSSEGPRFYGLEGVRALTQAECRRARNYGDVVTDMRRLDCPERLAAASDLELCGGR